MTQPSAQQPGTPQLAPAAGRHQHQWVPSIPGASYVSWDPHLRCSGCMEVKPIHLALAGIANPAAVKQVIDAANEVLARHPVESTSPEFNRWVQVLREALAALAAPAATVDPKEEA